MPQREGPAPGHAPKQAAGSSPARSPQTPTQGDRCLGAAAQLAAVRRTICHGPAVQLQAGGAGPPNRTGLPDALKAGVEALSGFSLDRVRVHHDSSKPAEINALAYTQGADIHVAPGQERHVPHEAWHVVQQAQGRVRPTMTLRRGLSVNDDGGLEREADVMGALAVRLGRASGRNCSGRPMSVPDGESHQPPVLATLAAVVQRTVAQISLAPGDPAVIEDVIVAGRPPPVHGSSMGDHSTAFIVQIMSVRRRVVGRTIAGAILGMDELIAELATLPGIALVETLPGTQNARFWAAYGRLLQVRAQLPSAQALRGQAKPDAPVDEVRAPLFLQDLITQYLELRELVPLSTTNVAAVAPALAGKGKGESGPAGALYASQLGRKVSRQVLRDAFCRMFDAASVAMVGAETDPKTLARLSPGLPAETHWLNRIRMMARQHFDAVFSAFPDALAAAFDSKEEAIQALLVRVAPRLVGEWQAVLASIPAWKVRNEQFAKVAQADLAILSKRATRQRGILDLVIKQAAADNQSLDERAKELEALIESVNPAYRPSGSVEVTRPPRERPTAETSADKAEQDKGSDEEADSRSPLAVQIRLDSVHRIAELEFAGRPPSPFSGSMGAHTTAWAVHLDRLRSLLRGRSLEEARDIVARLAVDTRKTGENSLKLFPIDKRHEGMLDAAWEWLVEALTACRGGPSIERPLQLQTAIGAYLAYVNLQPGATLNVAATQGRGEGKYRGLLVSYEAGRLNGVPPRVLAAAIRALFDVGDAEGEQIAELWTHHLKLVQAAYPNAYAASRIARRLDKDQLGRLAKPRPVGPKTAGAKRKHGKADEGPPGPELVAADGTIIDAARPTFISAYRNDIAQSHAYLNEADGHVLADALGIAVPVYRNRIPDGYQAFDMGSGGDCLIHSLVAARQELNGGTRRGADDNEIRALRSHIADALDPDGILASVAAAIHGHLSGAGEGGLGPRMRMLLGSPSVARARAAFREASSSGSRSAPSSSVSDSVPRPKKPRVGVLGGGGVPGPLLVMGSAAPSDAVAVLHIGGNHYVLLVRNSHARTASSHPSPA